MSRFLTHWAISAFSLAATAWLLPGVRVTSAGALLLAALVLGLLNAVLKPVLVLLTLPITLLTLGLFYLVLNGVCFALAATMVPGFEVSGFGSALLGAIVMGLLSALLGSILTPKREKRGQG